MKKIQKPVLIVPVIMFLALTLPTASWGDWTYFYNNADIRALYERADTLWVGTNGGLLFVDLLSGEVAGNITTGKTLPGASVRAIEGHRGNVYVGTDDGLTVFGRGGARVYTREDGAPFTNIRSISFGTTGAVYLGTLGHGVGVLDHGGLTRITKADSLLDNLVFGVSNVKPERTYFATALGLCAYRDSAWVGFQAGAGLPRGQVRQLLHLGEDRFYVLIAGRGLYRFNQRRAIRIRTDDELGGGTIAAVALDGRQRLWAVGGFGGIASYHRGVWTYHGEDNPDIAQGRWRTVYAAGDGKVYAGSADGLIAVVDGGEVRTMTLPSALPTGYIGPMVQDAEGRRYLINGSYLLSSREDPDEFSVDVEVGSAFALAVSPGGEVWLATPWGLLRRTADRWSEMNVDIEPVLPVFVSMTFDEWGDLWVGGHTGDVYRFDGDFWIPFTERHELSDGPIRSIAVDGHRVVWAVSRTDRLHRYDGLRWHTFENAELGSEAILSVTTDPTGEPLVVTEGHLWRYVNETGWQAIATPSTLEIGSFRAICFDAEGRLYLGAAAGLAMLENGSSTWLRSQDGLRGRDVTSVMVDDLGYLWVGFQADGISRIALHDLWRDHQ